MRLPTRVLRALPIVALPVALLVGSLAAQAQPVAIHVVMVDNSGPGNPPGGTGQGYYSFAPQHIVVSQGQPIIFDNPSTSRWPHSVESITWSGTVPYRNLEVGTAFDSSPEGSPNVSPGESWTLDTSALNPGQYLYYCALHPWMVGTFTLQPAS
jgi:plastocyanin